jgi:hypothetical protein
MSKLSFRSSSAFKSIVVPKKLNWKLRLVMFVIFPLSLLASCGEPLTLEQMLPVSVGQTNEIYVFCDSKTWKDTVGGYLNSALTKKIDHLTEPEQQFTITQFELASADKARMTHRNVIKVEINDRNENKTPRLVRSKDEWAKGQLLYSFKGPNSEKVMEIMQIELPGIIDEIKKKEMERFHQKFVDKPNKSAQRKLKSERGINLIVPNKLNLQYNREHFAWMEARGQGPEGKKVLHQGVFVYHYPYTNDSTFSYDFLIEKRNEMLKAHVQGGTKGSYLTTITEEGRQPEIKEINFNGEYAIEMKGLFDMKNGFMGGPFVSVTTFDKANGRIVTVEGYCYSPSLNQRDHLHEMEAVIYSATFDAMNEQGQN